MKRAGAGALVALVLGGCRWQPPAAPPPAACRVDLDCLVAAHPRWPELSALDARVARLRALLRQAPPVPGPARLARELPRIRVRQVPEPDVSARVLAELEASGPSTLRDRQQERERQDEQRLHQQRLEEQHALEEERYYQRALAYRELWQQQVAIIQRYQPRVTHLRLVVARLRDPAVVPGERERQEQELKQQEKELAALEQQRDQELDSLERNVLQRLEAEERARQERSEARLRELEAHLREVRETAAATARQEWQARLESARQALREPPPGPVTPATLRALAASSTAPLVRIRREAGRVPEEALRILSVLEARRARLAARLRAETERRVAAIARRDNLQLRTGNHRLPDRTDYFIRQLHLEPL